MAFRRQGSNRPRLHHPTTAALLPVLVLLTTFLITRGGLSRTFTLLVPKNDSQGQKSQLAAEISSLLVIRGSQSLSFARCILRMALPALDLQSGPAARFSPTDHGFPTNPGIGLTRSGFTRFCLPRAKWQLSGVTTHCRTRSFAVKNRIAANSRSEALPLAASPGILSHSCERSTQLAAACTARGIACEPIMKNSCPRGSVNACCGLDGDLEFVPLIVRARRPRT